MAICQNKTNYAGLYSLDNINGFELMIYQNRYTITLYNPQFAIKPEKSPRSDMVIVGNQANYKGNFLFREDSLYLFADDSRLIMKLFVIDSLSFKIVSNKTKANCLGDTILRFSSIILNERPEFWLWQFSGFPEFKNGTDRDMNWYFYNKGGPEVRIVPDTNCIHPYSKRFKQKE
jgi:hypothetical protein